MAKSDSKPRLYIPPEQRTENYIIKRLAYLEQRVVNCAAVFTEAYGDAWREAGTNGESGRYSVTSASNSKTLARILETYFERIDRFKLRHGMSTSDLLNEYKRAPAWIVVDPTLDEWRKLFRHNFPKKMPSQSRDDLKTIAVARLIAMLIYAELDISQSHVDHEVEYHLMHNIIKYSPQANFEWLVGYMYCLRKVPLLTVSAGKRDGD